MPFLRGREFLLTLFLFFSLFFCSAKGNDQKSTAMTNTTKQHGKLGEKNMTVTNSIMEATTRGSILSRSLPFPLPPFLPPPSPLALSTHLLCVEKQMGIGCLD